MNAVVAAQPAGRARCASSSRVDRRPRQVGPSLSTSGHGRDPQLRLGAEALLLCPAERKQRGARSGEAGRYSCSPAAKQERHPMTSALSGLVRSDHLGGVDHGGCIHADARAGAGVRAGERTARISVPRVAMGRARANQDAHAWSPAADSPPSHEYWNVRTAGRRWFTARLHWRGCPTSSSSTESFARATARAPRSTRRSLMRPAETAWPGSELSSRRRTTWPRSRDGWGWGGVSGSRFGRAAGRRASLGLGSRCLRAGFML